MREHDPKIDMNDYTNRLSTHGMQIISHDFRYLYLNKRLLSEIKMKLEDLVGRSMAEVFPGIENSLIYTAIKECFTSRKKRSVINEFTFPDGKTSYYKLQLEYIEKYNTVFIISQDITDEKNVEILLEKTNDRLTNEVHKQTQELLAINQTLTKEKERAILGERAASIFLANMSHEIRNPMNGLIGLLDILKETSLSAEQERYIDLSLSNAEYLISILNDVLDLSKIQSVGVNLHPTSVKLSDELVNIEAVFAAQIEKKGLLFQCNISEDVPNVILIDQVRIKQILFNLIGNAIKFTNQGKVRVSVKRHENFLTINVEDSGRGIPIDKLQTIFEPFVQVDNTLVRVEGGAGLGLCITKQLVDAMGGNIKVESTEHAGSLFHVSIPLVVPDIKAHRYSSIDEHQSAPQFTIKILIAEDNEINIVVLTEILNKIGCSYKVARNGEEAVAIFQKDDFDLGLFDLHMPLKDGLTSAKEIRAIEKTKDFRMPIFLLTADTINSLKPLPDVDGVLVKPVRRNTLVELIKKIASRSSQVVA